MQNTHVPLLFLQFLLAVTIIIRTFAARYLILNSNIMPRHSRQSSATGIYHVMLRGINQQNIFEDLEDYWKFLKLLDLTVHPVDELGHALPPRCTIYAYCMMTNHVHLLIKEGAEGLAAVIRSIAISYAIHYNKKYQRKGSLFQDRFKSEPVSDMAYFITLIRYIHQNPVAADIVKRVEDYSWSSWTEYDGTKHCLMPVCAIQQVLARISREDILAFIQDPLPKTLRILDFDSDVSGRVSDEELRDYLRDACGINSMTEVQHLPKEERDDTIRKLRQYGASIRQLARMTGISFGVIRKLE